MADIPESTGRIQIESTRFRGAVSEALLQRMGGAINYLLSAVLPVGSVVHSMLTEAQFQDEAGDGWILADGRSVADSSYAEITGFTTVPDLRGIFLRGKNNGRNTTLGNASGESALGTYQGDAFAEHSHSYSYQIPDAADGGSDGGGDTDRGLETINASTGSAGSTTETKPRNVTVNIFIRVN